MRVIGITGGIGSGKSSALQFLGAQGYPILDADQLVRQLSQPGGRAHESIQQAFGTADPQKLAQIIFKSDDPKAKALLESILHPLVKEESERFFSEAAHNPHAVQSAALGFYEASLLFESGRYKDLDGLLLLSAPLEVRRLRLARSRPHTPEEIERRITTQLSDSEKRLLARQSGIPFWEISNCGDLETLQKKLLHWLRSEIEID